LLNIVSLRAVNIGVKRLYRDAPAVHHCDASMTVICDVPGAECCDHLGPRRCDAAPAGRCDTDALHRTLSHHSRHTARAEGPAAEKSADQLGGPHRHVCRCQLELTPSGVQVLQLTGSSATLARDTDTGPGYQLVKPPAGIHRASTRAALLTQVPGPLTRHPAGHTPCRTRV